MSFSSPLFLFVFLPVVVAAHYLLPCRFKNAFLLAASIVYYIFADIPHLLPIICLIAVNYQFGAMLRYQQKPTRRHLFLTIAVVINILVLIHFKYSAFLIENINLAAGWVGFEPISIKTIAAPAGLSFIIFQIIAYLNDSYNEITEPQQNVAGFALFILFFSKITAGPIIRHNEVAESFRSRSVTSDDFVYGIKRFTIGLSKKVLLADVLAKSVDQTFSLPQNELGTGIQWLAILCYSLQIYYDFSGYSDMAIGVARMLGFTFQENFDRPYCARSLTEFWRRWHISLSTWLRDYLFIPMNYALTSKMAGKSGAFGGFKSKYISPVCIMIVFTVCGLWHGAAWTFVLWGALHGLVLSLESLGFSKIIKSWWRPFQHFYTLLIIMGTWTLFRSPSLDYAISFLKSMVFLPTDTAPPSLTLSDLMTQEAAVTLGIAIICVLPVRDIVSTITQRHGKSSQAAPDFSRSFLVESFSYTSYLTLLILSLASMASTTYNPFLYGKY